MQTWEFFLRSKIARIFQEKSSVIDIGGGLRISKKRGNRYDPAREWIRPLLEGTEYKILDPVADYNPDILGDIHNLPLPSFSQDAIICMAVLEHVEDPVRAVSEMHRVLKTGGYLFVYIPFLFYYHAESGYYHDYWRFTKDAIPLLFKKFSKIEICPVRGALSTWIKLSPLGRYKPTEVIFNFIDKLVGKNKSSQTSGYYVFIEK